MTIVISAITSDDVAAMGVFAFCRERGKSISLVSGPAGPTHSMPGQWRPGMVKCNCQYNHKCVGLQGNAVKHVIQKCHKLDLPSNVRYTTPTATL